MGTASFLRRFLARQKAAKHQTHSSGPLREFVYLDEVSVYSILASRKGGITTEFTEGLELTSRGEVEGSVGLRTPVINAGINSRLQAGQMQSSQVLRKAIIQTSFKELYDMEHESLKLVASAAEASLPPPISSTRDIEERLENYGDPWVLDPSRFRRGELVEIQVELEADPIYRLVSIIATFQELVEDNESLFGNEVLALVPQMRSTARLLERMLVDLVPIRGRLVDYKWATVSEREVLIHRRVLEQMLPTVQLESFPAYVVGVAQSGLFWKDIRRLLFSRAQYTMFCRLATGGLADAWHPVKVADVLAGIDPEFDTLMKQFSQSASKAMSGVGKDPEEPVDQYDYMASQLVEAYVELLLSHHNESLTPEMRNNVIADNPEGQDWIKAIDTQRVVLNDVTQRIDQSVGVKTSSEDAHDLRKTARQRVGLSLLRPSNGSIANASSSARMPHVEERFLDAEIIAIYW